MGFYGRYTLPLRDGNVDPGELVTWKKEILKPEFPQCLDPMNQIYQHLSVPRKIGEFTH